MGVCSTRLTLSNLVFAGQNWSTLRLTGGIRKLSGILAAFGGHVALMGGSAGVLGLVDRPQVRELVSAAVSHGDDVIGLERIVRDAGLAADLADAAHPGARPAPGPPQQDLPVVRVRGSVASSVPGRLPPPGAGLVPLAIDGPAGQARLVTSALLSGG